MSDVLQHISEHFDLLTNSQRSVAHYIMDNVGAVAFNTLDELAMKIGVSTTTVIRFARAIGYRGYTEMQQDIRDGIRGKVSLPERYSAATQNIQLDELLVDSFQNDIENINQTLVLLRDDLLRDAVNAMVQSRHVYVLGMRGSFSMAHLLSSRLGQIKDNVHLIQAIGDIYPEEINGSGQGDLCVAFMFPRYSKMTASLVSTLKKRGVKILLITSPNHDIINTYGDIILPCVVQSVSYKSSFVAPLCLINYLVTAVSMEDERAKEILDQTENVLSRGYYLGL